jgi:hypothetical protein
MSKAKNTAQDPGTRKPHSDETEEAVDSSTGTPRGGDPVDVPSTSGDTGTIKVRG